MGNVLLILGPFFVVIGIYGSIYAAKLLYRHWKFDDYGRELTASETENLEFLVENLLKDKKTMKYPKRYAWMTMGGIIPVFTGGGLTIGAFGIVYIFWRGQVLSKIPENAYRVDADTEFPFSLALALFTGMFLAGWIFIKRARQSIRLRKFLTYEIGWGTLHGHERNEDRFRKDIRHLIYGNKILPEDFETPPQSIATKIFEGMNEKWIAFSKLLFGLTVILLIFDVHSYSWIHENKFVKSDYFSFSESRFGIDEIREVEKSCYMAIPNKKFTVRLEYTVIGPEGETFGLGKKSWEEILPLIEEVESRVGYKTQIMKVDIAPALIDRVDKTKASCRKFLGQKYINQPELLSKLYSIFPLED